MEARKAGKPEQDKPRIDRYLQELGKLFHGRKTEVIEETDFSTANQR
jgi:hypothetical protein